MLGRLFQERSKKEKIEEMVRILKSRNALPETFGRDWYSPANLYRGSGAIREDKYYTNGAEVRGPWHNQQPKGRGMKFGEMKSSITCSRIPIEDTDYEWVRIESDRLTNGYVNQWEIDNDETGIYEGVEPLTLTRHKPGLQMKYKRLLDFKAALADDNPVPEKYRDEKLLDEDIEYFKQRIVECNRDMYGRTYLYFVIRTKQDGRPLAWIQFPTKMHQFHDFDKEWHADPLFDTDVAFNVLDQRLKVLIKDTVNGYSDINHDLNGNFDDIHGDASHLLAATEALDENIARTIAIKRAKPWVREKVKDELTQGRDGAMYSNQLAYDLHRRSNMFRLPLDCYAVSSGVPIPPEYFEVEGYGDDLNWKYYDTNAAIKANSKLILTDEKLKATREQLEDDIKNLGQTTIRDGGEGFVPASEIVIPEEINESLRTYIQKDEWPETTFGEYQKSLNSYKRSSLVYAHHLKHLLMDMKSHVFKNEKYLNIECKPEVRAELLEWYEHCIDTLVPEMLMFTRNLTPVKDIGAEPMPQLYHPKEAKNFLKSAARRRDWVPLPGGGARRRFPRRRAATPDRAQQDQGAVQNDQGLVEALEQQNFEPEEEDEIEVIIRDYNEGRQYQLERLVRILTLPIEMWQALRDQDLGSDNHRLVFDLQNWPHTTGNTGNWRLVKLLCQRWRQGLAVPLPDPRIQARDFMDLVGNDWPNAIPPARGHQNWGRGLYAALATLKDSDDIKE